jgi:hypothetical protein
VTRASRSELAREFFERTAGFDADGETAARVDAPLAEAVLI